MASIFNQEFFSAELVDEMKPLFKEHFEEVARFKDIPLDPDFEIYRAVSVIDGLRVFTVRGENKELYGYSVFFVRNNPHYRNSKQATQDILFLKKEFRIGTTAYRFINWCDEQLKNEGVQVVHHHVKFSNDFGGLLERLGYEAVEKIYSRRLDQWE